MPTCQTCKQTFVQIKFHTEDITICGYCVTAINGYQEPAESSHQTFREWLTRGMYGKNLARADDQSLPASQREKARRILKNLSEEVDLALPRWINRRLADVTKREKPYKILRAHRRGLLLRTHPGNWAYPRNWPEIARAIRLRDHFACQKCSATDVELHVHHIIFRSNYGTNQRHNLVTLCRTCHQGEHEHEFDQRETSLESGTVYPRRDNEEIFNELVSLAEAIQSTGGERHAELTESDAITAVVKLDKQIVNTTIESKVTQHESALPNNPAGLVGSHAQPKPSRSTSTKPHTLEIIALIIAVSMLFLAINVAISSLRS